MFEGAFQRLEREFLLSFNFSLIFILQYEHLPKQREDQRILSLIFTF